MEVPVRRYQTASRRSTAPKPGSAAAKTADTKAARGAGKGSTSATEFRAKARQEIRERNGG